MNRPWDQPASDDGTAPGDCPDREMLVRWSGGRLNPEELEEIGGHVAVCGQCALMLGTLDDASDPMLTALRSPAEAEELSAAEATSLVARVEAIHSSSVAFQTMPRTLGRYQLLDKLGEGGMGAVYKAMNVNLGKLVALKMISPGHLRDAGALQRLRREMKSVGALHHRHIVGAHDADEIDGVPFLVMEYVDGIDLAELTSRVGVLSIANACELIRQAALGLQYAHTNGLVHRDIKPSNLMLDVHGRVKILDLGLALMAEDCAQEITTAGSILGTADFMSPEQAGDSHLVDTRTDVYSLGCTLFKLLTGQPPFSGPQYNTPLKKVIAHGNQPAPAVIELRPDVPTELNALVARTLAKKPADRFASAGELAEALAPYCQGNRLAELIQHTQQQGVDLESSWARSAQLDPDTSAQAALVSTDASRPVGTNDIRLAQPQAAGGAPPRKPRRGLLLAAAGAGALAILLGVIVVIRDRDGKVLQTVEVPEGASVSIEKAGEKTGPVPDAAPKPPAAPALANAPFDAKQAREFQTAWAKQLGTPIERVNSIGMTLVLIPPGEFLMGSTPEQIAVGRKIAEDSGTTNEFMFSRLDEEAPQHRVILSKPFRLGGTEITVKQFRKFVEATKYITQAEEFGFGNSPATTPNDKVTENLYGLNWRVPGYKITEDSPVTQVSWNDAVQFCNWLSEQEKLQACYRQDFKSGWINVSEGTGYRLPTEAEWEFACRAGTATQFSFGDDVSLFDQYGWSYDNAQGACRAVGLKAANPFGLFDMHGNAAEWCQDFVAGAYDALSPATDPLGPAKASNHVVRGGHVDGNLVYCRSAYRFRSVPVGRTKSRGFRVVCASIAAP